MAKAAQRAPNVKYMFFCHIVVGAKRTANQQRSARAQNGNGISALGKAVAFFCRMRRQFYKKFNNFAKKDSLFD